MSRLSGSKIVAPDYQFPVVVNAFGNGANVITATTFTDLPSFSCSAAITNPHPTASLVVMVFYGAWLASSGVAVRFCPRVSGSITIAAGVGAGGPIGWGEVPMTANSGNPQQHQGMATYTLPASATAATFTIQAMRDSASGTQTCNYATLEVVPMNFVL